MKIEELNQNFEFLEWNHFYYDTWEILEHPDRISEHEKCLALKFLDFMKVDIDQQELITLRTTPVNLGFLIINFFRKQGFEISKKNAQNFCTCLEQ